MMHRKSRRCCALQHDGRSFRGGLLALLVPFLVLAPAAGHAQGSRTGAASQPQAQSAPQPLPPAQGKPLLAVLEFDSRLADTPELRDGRGYLADLVRNRIKDLLPWLEVITRENVVALLSSQGKTLEDCQKDGECEVQTGQRLGADYVVSGALVPLGGELRLTLKLHDTHSQGLLKGLTAPGKDLRELEANLPRAVDQLLAPLLDTGTGQVKGPGARAATGELFLSVSPPGATYQLDGGAARPLGASGTGLVTLPLGKHRVLLRLSGYQDAEREVLVQAGAPVSVKVSLLLPVPERAAARGKGFLTVESTPDQAAIFLDGRDTGMVTPANFPDLAPGAHEVVLKRNLYLDHREQRVLRDDEPVAMVVSLVPDFGDLVLESTPAGAAIALDGELRDEKTPATLKRIASGAHRVALTLARHDGAQKTLVVEPGGTQSFRAALTAVYARVRIDSEPSGATVFVDDAEVGVTPLVRELERGPHRVRLRLRKYAEHAEVLLVEAGKEVQIARTLVAKFGSLRVTALAAGQPVLGAQVLVQGEVRGELSGAEALELTELPEGVVTVEVRAALHQGFSTEVKIAAGLPKEVVAVLVPEYGFVQVKADQNATVLVDGRTQGPADGRSVRVKMGAHRIVVAPAEPARYRPVEREVVVGALGTERVEEKLVPRMGKLVVMSTPSGAALSIDGRALGQTPKALELFAGTVEISLVKERFVDWAGTATVKEGETGSVAAAMKGVDVVQYEAEQRGKAKVRAAWWALGGAVVIAGAGGSQYLARGYAEQRDSAMARYAGSVEPSVVTAARGEAVAADGNARTAQWVALGLAAAAVVPVGMLVWTLVSAP